MSVVIENEKYIFTTDELNDILEREKNIVIYGAGNYGKRTVDYIFSVGQQYKIENFWVTHKKTQHDYRGIKVLEAGEGNLIGCKDSLIVIAVSGAYLFEIAEIVQQYGRRYCCITLDLYVELGRRLIVELSDGQIVPFEKLDFLVAGFYKCGTTSLHKALMDIADVYLSERKESLFFGWSDKVSNPKERLIEEYFYHIQDGQIVGMVEPTFDIMSEQIYNFFGSQVKILFLVRNPIDAEFSYFKMISRSGAAMLLCDAYRQTSGGCRADTFERFFEQYKTKDIIDKYRYVDKIKQFLKYYPKEQIKIVIFEEMVRNPREVINDILRFIGSSCEYMYDNLPWENEGNYVMADINGLAIAASMGNNLWEYSYIDGTLDGKRRNEFYEMIKIQEQYNCAKKIYNLELPEETRRKLELYYDNSVRELEIMLNKDLSKIWF